MKKHEAKIQFIASQLRKAHSSPDLTQSSVYLYNALNAAVEMIEELANRLEALETAHERHAAFPGHGYEFLQSVGWTADEKRKLEEGHGR